MSLSKYYKSSNSFKPEKIVKQSDDSSPGWQSTSRQNQDPFKHSQLSEEAKKLPQSPASVAADNATLPEETEEQQDIPPGAQHPEAIDIDLSSFIEFSEHEMQMEQAYQRGVRDSLKNIDQDYQTAAKTLLTLCSQLDETRNTIINNSYRELQEFALAIAERILRISIAEQDLTIVATLEEALQKAVKSDEFTIYIHPEDYDTVSKKSQDLVAAISGLNHLVLKKDITVERGGARIESDNCIIDATICSQFDTIREAVRNKS